MSPTRLLIICLALLTITLPTYAQDADMDTMRDPLALARRLLGYDSDFAIPPPTPLYEPGDTAEFWVGKAGTDVPTKVQAQLIAGTDNLYLWAEDGLTAPRESMQQVAAQLGQIYNTLRLETIYGNPTIIPDVGQITDPTSLLPVPNVDGDPHLFILYAAGLGEEWYYISAHDQLPAEIAPGGYSNQHEMIIVNTSALVETPLDSGVYTTILTEAIYEFLAHHHTPMQDQWLKEALALLLGRLLEVPDIRPNSGALFIAQPNTPLIGPASRASTIATEGAQQIFLDYAIQRFDFPLIQAVFQEPGVGLQAFDAALTAGDLVDPLTGKPITANQLFADYAAANIASFLTGGLFGDGRYLQRSPLLPVDNPPGAAGVVLNLSDGLTTQASVNQYGTQYYIVANPQDAAFTITFEGEPQTPLLRLPEDADPANQFYWSGRGQNQAANLTRAFDLTGVESATLTFDLWFDLPPARSYAYVEVSTDGGDSWAIVAGDLTSTNNRFGLAYGSGYTGISSREAPRPFPIMGVVLAGDGITISEIVPDGPASSTDLQVNDVIIGYDEQLWSAPPDVIGLLATYDPGDTLNLYVRRGEERLSIPLRLGEHPSRVKPPDPVWVTQEIDLSAYAGQEILLRFEYISQPQGGGYGVAVDNIVIPEIDYADDAQGEMDWMLHGWQQVDNFVEQRFVLQYLSSGTPDSPPRVRHLIAPGSTDTNGTWRFTVGANEVVAFALSGLNDDTLLPAQYTLVIEAAE